MSPHHNGRCVVTSDIVAGGEIFESYGDHWFEERAQKYGFVPQKGEEQNPTRIVEELRETGRCIDNIRHGTSTLPHAGRGAFATRPIKKGSIITGPPLIHVPTLQMAVIHQDKNSTSTHYHLWIKYCIGHTDGDLLLCPYGSGVNYINHNQTLANVKLQWAPNGIQTQNNSWFQKSTWDEEEVTITHSLMDCAATRDIREGEELFLDYEMIGKLRGPNMWKIGNRPRRIECTCRRLNGMRSTPMMPFEHE